MIYVVSLFLVLFETIQDVNLFLEIKSLAINELEYFIRVQIFSSSLIFF